MGSGQADLSFDHVPLLDGAFTLAIELKSRMSVVFDRRELLPFEVMNPGRSRGTAAMELRVELKTASLS